MELILHVVTSIVHCRLYVVTDLLFRPWNIVKMKCFYLCVRACVRACVCFGGGVVVLVGVLCVVCMSGP